MEIAFFKEKITPEIGAYLAGYGLNDKSVAILDDLYACGLYMDDGNKKALIISLDLLGLDEWFIKKCRKNISGILEIPEAAVMLTCTHTHTGPETRTLASAPQQLHTAYLDKLEKILSAEAEKLLSATFTDCNEFFYSEYCDANRNRRYVAGDNHATFTPHRREVIGSAEKLFADKADKVISYCDKVAQLFIACGNYHEPITDDVEKSQQLFDGLTALTAEVSALGPLPCQREKHFLEVHQELIQIAEDIYKAAKGK